LALQIENAILNSGGKICYSDARSLAKTLTMFRPTVFAGVPKVYEILRDALVKKIESSLYVKILFNVLFAWKSFLLSHGLDSPVTNIFFKQISKKIFGGVLQYAVSGGGSLNAALHNFCRVVFCCPIIQGYALTETCVGGAFQDTCDLRDGVVGPPVPCVEMMLQSEPDIKDSAGMPYLHTDTVGAKGEVVLGRGEICMRGPCISNGYYKMPEKTKEVYDEEGWFHSGDIGQFTSDGVLQIIDRKKNIVKLKGGEYVAVENMENAYSQSPLVASACVVANGDLDRALVIVHANNSALEKWAVDHGISYGSVHDLAVNKEIKQAVIASMKACGKEAGLTSLENGISDCVLVTDVAWEAGHGFTASGKIDRAAIFKMHGDQLNAMLQRNGAPPLS
jgi:long-chain acyl-CoA synthetase